LDSARAHASGLRPRLVVAGYWRFLCFELRRLDFGVINSSALWQARLLFPVLMILAIPTALGWDALNQLDSSNLRISFLVNHVDCYRHHAHNFR
jgi:hypothetical protein